MKNLIALFFLVSLFGCDKKQNTNELNTNSIVIKDRILSPKTALSTLFDSLRTNIQSFEISGDKDTLLVGQNGSTFWIPKHTFLTSQGIPASSITINLVEVNSISEIIRNNLQTMSDNKILKTGGMFFLDAKENEKSLIIANGKSIFVEVKSNISIPQMKIFDGSFDNYGKINWNLSGNLENTLIPMPLNLINFYKCNFECSFSQKQIAELTNSKFENTFIATREFENRCCIMNVTTCDWFNNLSQKILDIYMNNIDKPLYYSDSLVVSYLNVKHPDKIDLNKEFDYDEVGWTTYLFRMFTYFKEQKLTNTINFDKLGISSRTTIEELVAKGFTKVDAEKYIAFFNLQKQNIKIRKEEKQILQLSSYSFSINKLGWVNVDYFINMDGMEETSFTVNIQCKDSLNYVSVSLVFPEDKISVYSSFNEGNNYSFTKKEKGLDKLPVGKNAVIVALSYKDDKPYFAQKKIKIPKDGEIILSLNQTKIEKIKDEISKLEN